MEKSVTVTKLLFFLCGSVCTAAFYTTILLCFFIFGNDLMNDGRAHIYLDENAIHEMERAG